MTLASAVLAGVRASIAPDDGTLSEARVRRDLIFSAAASFPGFARHFPSGSLAHRVMNGQVHATRNKTFDVDVGVVLDRRAWPAYGPDGTERRGPQAMIDMLRDHLREPIRVAYPDATVGESKRGALVRFNSPLPNGDDPTADVVPGLPAASGSLLWIPNRPAGRWTESAAEEHTKLLLDSSNRSLLQTRRRVIRLAKAWNELWSDPAFCSFHLSVLAYNALSNGGDEATALLTVFEHGAEQLAVRDTPALALPGRTIKTKSDRSVAASRLDSAATKLREAIDADSEDDARECLRGLFGTHVDSDTSKREALAAGLRAGLPVLAIGTALALGGAMAGAASAVKRGRAHGDIR